MKKASLFAAVAALALCAMPRMGLAQTGKFECAWLPAGQKPSAEVAALLAAGDPLGRVGNSGNTTEPHLHVHAVDPETGQGVPVSFGGRSPVRNRLYIN